MYSSQFSREWAWRTLSSNQTFPPPFIKGTHKLMLGSSTSFLGGKKPVDFSSGPRGCCTAWPIFSTDFPEAGWDGTPHRAKSPAENRGRICSFKNIQHSEKALFPHKQAESEECFLSEFFFFHIMYHTCVCSAPKTTFSHGICQGKTWGGKIRVTSSLRARLYRKSHWTTPSLGFIGWQERLTLP